MAKSQFVMAAVAAATATWATASRETLSLQCFPITMLDDTAIQSATHVMLLFSAFNTMLHAFEVITCKTVMKL
jgi:hypothetical protein